MLFAVTGGIGAGKTTVLRYFAEMGCAAADADEISHSLTYPGSPVCQTIVQRWGQDFLTPEGALDRKRVAKKVFADETERRWLEQQLHPEIGRRILALAQEATASGKPLLCAVPLLYETGWDKDFTAVISVWCPPEIQKARLLGRGWSEEECTRRCQAQLSMDEKCERADYVIQSDCSWEMLAEQCRETLALMAETYGFSLPNLRKE